MISRRSALGGIIGVIAGWCLLGKTEGKPRYCSANELDVNIESCQRRAFQTGEIPSLVVVKR